MGAEPAGGRAWAGERVAVTGSGGRVGRRLVALLLRRGARVVAVDREPGVAGSPELEAHRIDLVEPAGLAEAFGGCRVLFHLAGEASGAASLRAPGATFASNVGGTLVAAETARRVGLDRIVFASTGLVYASARRPLVEEDRTDPATPYAASKLAAEACLHGYASASRVLAVEVARLSNVYGPEDGEGTVTGRALAQARRGEPIVLDDLEPVRDFLHVDDAAEGLLRLGLVGSQPGFRVTNLSSGVGVSVRGLAGALIEAAASRGARRLELVEPATASAHPDPERVLDNAALRHRTGWEPRIPLAGGLLAVWDHTGAELPR